MNKKQLANEYKHAERRLLLLDYDGVLAPIVPLPEQAKPSEATYQLLEKLTLDPKNRCVVISGRPRQILEDWLGGLPLDFAAEHGLWRRIAGKEWETITDVDMEWKAPAEAVMRQCESRLQSSFIEKKHAALAFHYRNVADQEEAARLVAKLVNDLKRLTTATPLQVLDGKKVVEVLPLGVDKGTAANFWIQDFTGDFILAAGDDVTDEAMFRVLPTSAHSIKVGTGPTAAHTTIDSQPEFIRLLQALANSE